MKRFTVQPALPRLTDANREAVPMIPTRIGRGALAWMADGHFWLDWQWQQCSRSASPQQPDPSHWHAPAVDAGH
jgi:hypothetical protein